MSPLRHLSRLALCATTLLFALASAAQAETLTIWGGFPELEPFYQRIATAMQAKHPGLKVEISTVGLRDHEKRVALALPANSAGDLIELVNVTAQRYIEAGLLKPLTAGAAGFVHDDKKFDSFIQKVATWQDKTYGMPLFRGQTALYYNLDMLAKAGLQGPPKTTDDYDTYAQKLTQRNAQGTPVVSGWSLRLNGGGGGVTDKFSINLFQFGGSILAPRPDGKWVAAYASEAGRKALAQYLNNLMVTKTDTIEMPADADAFERGQTAMFIRESWVIGDIAAKAPNLHYATAPLPRGCLVVPVLLYTPAEGPQRELAQEFAELANNPDDLVWMLRNVGWLPNRRDVDYAPVIAEKPAFAAFVNAPPGYQYFATPAIGVITDIGTRLETRLVRAFSDTSLVGNDAKIDAFLAEAAVETNTILRRAGLLGTP